MQANQWVADHTRAIQASKLSHHNFLHHLPSAQSSGFTVKPPIYPVIVNITVRTWRYAVLIKLCCTVWILHSFLSHDHSQSKSRARSNAKHELPDLLWSEVDLTERNF